MPAPPSLKHFLSDRPGRPSASARRNSRGVIRPDPCVRSTRLTPRPFCSSRQGGVQVASPRDIAVSTLSNHKPPAARYDASAGNPARSGLCLAPQLAVLMARDQALRRAQGARVFESSSSRLALPPVPLVVGVLKTTRALRDDRIRRRCGIHAPPHSPEGRITHSTGSVRVKRILPFTEPRGLAPPKLDLFLPGRNGA